MISLTESRLTVIRTSGFPLLILGSLVLGYWPLFQRLTSTWDSGDNSYGYLIIPLFLYLCWEKRDSFRFSQFSWSLAGIGVTILSALLLLVGEVGSMETLIFVGIWGSFVGIMASRPIIMVYPVDISHGWVTMAIVSKHLAKGGESNDANHSI